jgi:hypothetical protein
MLTGHAVPPIRHSRAQGSLNQSLDVVTAIAQGDAVVPDIDHAPLDSAAGIRVSI